MAPAPLAKAYFVNSGSEAIDTAIKLIWYYQNARGLPEKKKLIARQRAYHGITVAAGHLTGSLAYTTGGFDLPMMDRFRHVTAPNLYRYGLPGETEAQFVDRLAEELEDLILAEGPETIAAFFAEPVQGAGGVLVPPKGYFQRVQEILKRHDILFVADEVICGFGRTGNAWGCDTFGIRPDLLTCAKQLSSAYLPIAALLMSDAFYQVLADQSEKLGTLGMGYTYGGHPVSAAVALETLKIYEEDGTFDHVREVEPHFLRRLKKLEAHPAGRRGARHRADRRGRDRAQQGDPRAVRPRPQGQCADRGQVPGARPAAPAAAGRFDRHLPADDHHRPRRSISCSTGCRRPWTTAWAPCRWRPEPMAAAAASLADATASAHRCARAGAGVARLRGLGRRRAGCGSGSPSGSRSTASGTSSCPGPIRCGRISGWSPADRRPAAHRATGSPG